MQPPTVIDEVIEDESIDHDMFDILSIGKEEHSPKPIIDFTETNNSCEIGLIDSVP